MFFDWFNSINNVRIDFNPSSLLLDLTTLILFDKGNEVKRTIGFIDKERIEKFID